jgi:hypothetical protein
MAITDLISINITGHGRFTVEVNDFDRMMVRHLPASAYGLRQKINERSDYPAGHYDDVHTVTELLMILAKYEGFGR